MRWLDIFSQPVELTEERWKHIVTEHPEMFEHQEKLPLVLALPDYVKQSKRDENVLLYYRYFSEIFGGKFLLVAVKRDPVRPFVLTGYITRSVIKGQTVWEKS